MATNSRRQRFAALLPGGLAMVAVVASAAWAQDGQNQTDIVTAKVAITEPVNKHPRANTYMKRRWGIEIVYVRQTAAGYMLEFRYKVVDSEKAGPLFDRQTKPLLTHVESGAKFIVPTPAKTGALRNSNPPLADHTYWMFFANPGKFVKSGEHVNIEIGEFIAEGLVVQ